MTKKSGNFQICLYGTRTAGFGYIASGLAKACEGGKLVELSTGAVRLFGKGGEELKYESMTEALYAAQAALKEAKGKPGAEVTVFGPGGEMCATVELGGCQNIGELKWGPAPVYVFK